MRTQPTYPCTPAPYLQMQLVGHQVPEGALDEAHALAPAAPPAPLLAPRLMPEQRLCLRASSCHIMRNSGCKQIGCADGQGNPACSRQHDRYLFVVLLQPASAGLLVRSMAQCDYRLHKSPHFQCGA